MRITYIFGPFSNVVVVQISNIRCAFELYDEVRSTIYSRKPVYAHDHPWERHRRERASVGLCGAAEMKSELEKLDGPHRDPVP